MAALKIIASRDAGQRDPSLATGPFDSDEAAQEFRRHLAATTGPGEHVVLSLHTPDTGVDVESLLAGRAAIEACLAALGARWRGDWSDFDGRTLRAQLDEVVKGCLHSEDPKAFAREFVIEQGTAND